MELYKDTLVKSEKRRECFNCKTITPIKDLEVINLSVDAKIGKELNKQETIYFCKYCLMNKRLHIDFKINIE